MALKLHCWIILKRRFGPIHFFILQVCVYAAALFEQLGSLRRHILLALTNLKEITFLRVTQDPNTKVNSYEMSKGIDNVLGALCHVLRMEAEEVCEGGGC